MRLIIIFLSCIILLQDDVFAEISSSSCALLRTASSLTTIVPEVAQLALRFYRTSSSVPTNPHRRQKRFLFGDNPSKNGSSGTAKGTVVEQMMANAVRDVNFTNVVLLILSNNETRNKIQKNVDMDGILRIIVREIDYEKLGSGLWTAAENHFDLEHFIGSIINMTRLDVIHHELLTNGTFPSWLVKSVYPDLNDQVFQRMFSTLKNVTAKFIRVLSKSERFDNYLFNMITQQALTPLNNIIQGVKEEKPKTFDELIEIIVNNVNQVAMEQFTQNSKAVTTKKPGTKASTPSPSTVDLNNSDDVKLMLYQWSIAVDSMGQTARVILKSLERLYCASN